MEWVALEEVRYPSPDTALYTDTTNTNTVAALAQAEIEVKLE